MGRELRRVPPNWEHPTRSCRHTPGCVVCFQPMYDEGYDDAAQEWLESCILWSKGEYPDQKEYESAAKYKYYWEWGESNPPDKNYYRPYTNEEATWYQVYETVSEGTPVTPPFETKEELVKYLIESGDFWDQDRLARGHSWGRSSWGKEEAENFVYKEGWAPSMIMQGGVLKRGTEL